MNPFNQSRFRGEHELGRAYMDIRKALDNLADIKLVADNIIQLRSGNIELSSEGSVLKWKYVNESEWHDLVDLQVLVEDTENTLTQLNQTIQNFNTELTNLNGIVSGHQNTLDTLGQRVSTTEEYEARISENESKVSDNESELSTIQGLIDALTQRVETLESEPEV